MDMCFHLPAAHLQLYGHLDNDLALGGGCTMGTLLCRDITSITFGLKLSEIRSDEAFLEIRC